MSEEGTIMARLLVTGGRGGLGRELVPRLHGAGHTVRISSRSAQPAGAKHDATEWARLDLVDGAGIEAAVAGIEVVVHAATSPFWRTRATDVEGTRRPPA